MTAKLAVYGAYDDTPLRCPSQAMTSPKKALSGGLKALPKPAFTPTDEQVAILDAVARLPPGQLLKIQARAGTGKTATLELLAYAQPNRSLLYLAYNADIAAEAKKRFPATVTVKTTHGLAWSALAIQDWIETKGPPRNVRAWELEKWLHAKRWNPNLNTGASLANIAADVLATVRAFLHSADSCLEFKHGRCLAKKTHLDAFRAVAKEENPEDSKRAERYALDSYGRYRAWLVEKANELWRAMVDRFDPCIPLEHDAYLKLFQLQHPVLAYNLILLDEAQDTNPCVMALFLSQSAAKVMVGDEFQAIYGFRGATDALQTPGCELPLTQSFRFGPALAAQANTILHVRMKPFAALRGTPTRNSRIGLMDGPPYTVICRSNRGVFEKALIAASAGLKINSGAKDLEEAILYVESAWALCVGQRLPKRHSDIAEFGDWAVLEQESQSDEALKWLIKLVEEHREDMPAVCERLRAAKTRMKKSADVLLVTAHKSKGLEFDRVILADDFIILDIYIEKAKAAPADQRQDALTRIPVQELNLLYVAATRAKHLLQPNNSLKLIATLDGLEETT
ncbi:MAG: UvrD-helicase domain-containing protein [Candidatus Competibacteraceae bacterium]